MEIKLMKISELRPSDTPRDETLAYYMSLSSTELSRYIPQVWKVNGEHIISDGNNLTTFYAHQGFNEIRVDYRGNASQSMFGHIIDETERDSDILRELGVETPKDMVNLVKWDRLSACNVKT